MIIDFKKLEENIVPHFKGGEGRYIMKHYTDEHVKIMYGRLEPGSSIGLHRHEGNREIIYVLSGHGTAMCDGVPEPLGPGDCHFCPEGHEHQLVNDGTGPLVFLAVVPGPKA